MYVSIRKYEGCGDTREIDARAQRELLPALRQQPGFISYSIVDFGGGSVASISVFATMAQIEAANESVRELVQRTFKDLLPNTPAIMIGELISENRRQN